MAATSEWCKLLVFVTSRESVPWNPDAKVITNIIHFRFNLNLKKKKVPQYKQQLTEYAVISAFFSYS